MKTTVKKITIPTPSGKKETIYLGDFATKEAFAVEVERIANLEQITKDDEDVVVQALDNLRKAIGADENSNVSFSGTNHLDGATTVKEALEIIDSLLQ